MKENTTYFGFWVYLMSDCVLFAGLFATYAVLHGETYGAGTPAELFSVPFVLIETLILLTSSFTMGLALLNAQASQARTVAIWLGVTLVLGWAFLGMEISEFARLAAEGHGPSHSAFLSAFFTLVGTHGLHVAVGSLWMLVVAGHLWFKGFTQGSVRKLTLLTIFWHFLDVIWIFIFTIVYLLGVL